jgi:hypothetical protein
MNTLPEILNEIIKQQTPGHIKGQLIDHYTAALIRTVYTKLNEDNKKVFLSKSVNEMVAIAYKMVTS